MFSSFLMLQSHSDRLCLGCVWSREGNVRCSDITGFFLVEGTCSLKAFFFFFKSLFSCFLSLLMLSVVTTVFLKTEAEALQSLASATAIERDLVALSALGQAASEHTRYNELGNAAACMC